ncbi:non-SMC condensin II complex subunit [Aureococcus anophagefferens]|uniref:Non-SMC condensin II complex subunit n=1 Tax=Aureococcus anophagefferens TaxID=44056 RepID=A0ABR1G6L6_AURAN
MEGAQHARDGMNTEDSDAENNYGTPPDVVAAVEFFNELDGDRTIVFGRAPSIASYVRTIVASEAATSASGAFAAEVAAAVHQRADAVRAAAGAAKGKALDDCFGAGVALCDALLELELGDAGDAAQEAVAAAGEALWPRAARRRREDATGGDVRRALKAQGMVDLIDFGDGSSGTLLGLLARTAAAPAFVKHAHGRSFVGGLLGGACEVLAAATHKTVKAQLPLASPGLALHYGDCYFRGWEHAAKRDALEDFEEFRLQDLARARALFCRDGRLAAPQIGPAAARAQGRPRGRQGSKRERFKGSISAVFHSFRLIFGRARLEAWAFSGTRARASKSTIERVYAPLLWRHLACPNATARKRAVTILAAAFPVVADTAKASKKEAVGLALEDQLERLRRYWDALPRGSAGRLVKALASTCARDAASAKVREAAVKGLAELAESPALCGDATRAHAVGDAALAAALKDALPRSLHDTAPRCRLAAANCLAAYAASRGVDAALACVKPKDALARLGAARENPKTTLALAKVLVDAYFPLKRHKDDAEAAPKQVSAPSSSRAATARRGRALRPPRRRRARRRRRQVGGHARRRRGRGGGGGRRRARRPAKKPKKKSRKRRQADEEDEEDSDDDDEPPPEELAGGALARAMVRAAALAYGSLDRSALGAGDDGSERLAAYLRDGVGPALRGSPASPTPRTCARSPRRARPSPAATSARGGSRCATRWRAAADSEDAVLDVAARVCAADVDGDGVANRRLAAASSSSSSPSAASAAVLGAALAAAGDVLAGAGPALTRVLAEAAEAWLAPPRRPPRGAARADAALALAPPLLRLAARLRGAGALDASHDAPLLRVLGARSPATTLARARRRATLKVALRDTARRSTLLGALADVAQWTAVADAATPRKARPAGSAGASELLAVVALDEGAALEALACGLDASLLLPHAPPSLAAKIRDAAAPPAPPPAAPALSQAY